MLCMLVKTVASLKDSDVAMLLSMTMDAKNRISPFSIWFVCVYNYMSVFVLVWLCRLNYLFLANVLS